MAGSRNTGLIAVWTWLQGPSGHGAWMRHQLSESHGPGASAAWQVRVLHGLWTLLHLWRHQRLPGWLGGEVSKEKAQHPHMLPPGSSTCSKQPAWAHLSYFRWGSVWVIPWNVHRRGSEVLVSTSSVYLSRKNPVLLLCSPDCNHCNPPALLTPSMSAVPAGILR